MAIVPMYKGEAVCTADRDQVEAMEKIGWSLDKETPKAEQAPKEVKETPKEAPKEEVQEAPPKKRRPSKK